MFVLINQKAMSIKKIVIGPTNTKAIKFFEDLDRKKVEFNKKAEAKLNKFMSAKEL